jgi:hypothetical protein
MQFQEHPDAMEAISDARNEHAQEVVRLVHEELQKLLQQRADVMRRIRTIKLTIAGLNTLLGGDRSSDELLELVDRKSSMREQGFTKVCHTVLRVANRALSISDVCDRIQEMSSLILARKKDPIASVTTALNRLVVRGEAQAVALENGCRAWQLFHESATSEMGTYLAPFLK